MYVIDYLAVHDNWLWEVVVDDETGHESDDEAFAAKMISTFRIP